jgi:tetratricopeptide (TPR) repeat protein
MSEARAPFERALHYEPEHLSSLVHLARLAALEGRAAELDALVNRVLQLSPAGDRALSMRALRAFALRNEIEKARIVAALVRARALAVGIAFTDVVLYARDITGSHRLARIVTRLTRAPEGKALCHIVLAHLDLTRGRVAKAISNLERATAHDEAWGLEMRALFAILPFRAPQRAEIEGIRDALARWDPRSAAPNANQVLAAHNGVHDVLRRYLLGALDVRLGQFREALDAAGELEGMPGSDSRGRFAGHLGQSIRAQVARAEEKPADALRILAASQPEIWYQLAITSPFYSAALERYLRADLLCALGRPEEALGWYATLGESSPYELVYLAPAHLAQAEIHGAAGRWDRAAEHRARAEELWTGSDEELRART